MITEIISLLSCIVRFGVQGKRFFMHARMLSILVRITGRFIRTKTQAGDRGDGVRQARKRVGQRLEGRCFDPSRESSGLWLPVFAVASATSTCYWGLSVGCSLW